jgi:hypothetical protein
MSDISCTQKFKKAGISIFLFFIICTLSSCREEIEEPKHKNKGKNVLYMELDGQGHLLSECGRVFKNIKNRGNLFVPILKDKKPEVKRIFKYGEIFYRFGLYYCFEIQDDSRSTCGQFFIDFRQDTTGKWVLKATGVNTKLYSPKHSAMINLFKQKIIGNPIFELERFDRKKEIIAGNIEIDFKDIDYGYESHFRMYFDADIDFIAE